MIRAKVRIKFALLALIVSSAGICGYLLLKDEDHHQNMDDLARAFKEEPSPKRLKKLLEYPSDGGYSYYHMALVGEAFTVAPDQFRVLAREADSDRQRFWIEMLASTADGLFEYYPEREPQNFDDLYAKHQDWLSSHK